MCRPVPQILTQFQTKIYHFPHPSSDLAPVVQRPDNFIQWISHYPTVSICATISVFPRLQANMHTPTTAKCESVRKPWTNQVFHGKPQTANCSLRLGVCSFRLPGFRSLARRSTCFMPPCCFSSSRSASLLSPKKLE